MIWQGDGPINQQGQLVIISGYYGYDNMGDEAILETTVGELKQIVPANQIVVLSANPDATKDIYSVDSINRFDFVQLAKLLPRARLFISGGGGLFQDTKSFGSPAYYGLQIFLAKAFNVPVFVFAQGIGPLKGILARTFTKSALSLSSFTTVRDHESDKLLSDWFIQHEITADPVWCLKPNTTEPPLPTTNGPLVGLSLRPSAALTDEHLKQLADILDKNLTAETTIVLLALQPSQDLPVLTKFSQYWQAKNRSAILFDSGQCPLPSQWLSIIGSLNFLISMRLHALIMGISSGRPVLGINYDPKVAQLLEDLDLPMLNLTNDTTSKWPDLVRNALANGKELSLQAARESLALKKVACQNFAILAKILSSTTP